MSVANDVAKDLSDEISARKLCAKKIYDELSHAISSVSNDLLDKISDVVKTKTYTVTIRHFLVFWLRICSVISGLRNQ